MSKKSPFAIHKALLGIGGEPKFIKRLRSGDLLIETQSSLQTKSFLLAKTFLDSPVTISPHKTLNSSRDCRLEQKCINCSQPHTSDSKLCSKWKAEKEIQAIKTNRNISYAEARKLVAPQLSQTYAQVAKPSTVTSITQTDENITIIKCPPLQLLPPLSAVPQPNAHTHTHTSPSIPSVSTSSSTSQANLLPSASLIKPTTKIESRLPKPISSSAAPDNSLNTSSSSLSAETCPVPTISNKFAALQPSVPLSESAATTPNSELSNISKVPLNVKQN
ncbi:uncharacterized protein TNCV_4718561 [Trichonephila clavipes]|nr:uncharacterized protein TNCV_4718561 [Trichonephila clavipes]